MSTFRRLASKTLLKGHSVTSRVQFLSTQKWLKSVHVLAQFQIKPDRIDDFLSAVEPCINLTNEEKGCVTYNIHQDRANGNKFMMIEEWASRAALDEHLETDHVKAFSAKMESLAEKDAVISIYGGPMVKLNKK